MSAEPPSRAPIRSFVLRQGRMTDGQKRALEAHWPRYGLPEDGVWDLDALFGRAAPRHLEIGFGMGGALLDMARAHPEHDYLGIEVHLPGVGRLLGQLALENLENVRVSRSDAVKVLERQLPACSLNAVYLFFPDPWPKQRHHKRRMVQPEFARRVARVLKPGGVLHLATDWEDYARHMLAVMETQADFTNRAGPGRFSPRPPERPLTKFEQRGQKLGHGIWDLVYARAPW